MGDTNFALSANKKVNQLGLPLPLHPEARQNRTQNPDPLITLWVLLALVSEVDKQLSTTGQHSACQAATDPRDTSQPAN